MSAYLTFLAGFYILSAASQHSEDEQLRIKHFNIDKNGLALQGYDPVSYFSGKPKKGLKKYKSKYLGCTYYFSAEKNSTDFIKSPQKYEPAFGGWCAYAIGNTNEKVEINPTTYKIVDGQLYLFYDAYFTNTLLLWNKDEKSLLSKAIKNWNVRYK